MVIKVNWRVIGLQRYGLDQQPLLHGQSLLINEILLNIGMGLLHAYTPPYRQNSLH